MADLPNKSSGVGRLSPEQSQRSEIFYDRRVLRAGWGILLFLALFLATMAIETLSLVHFGNLQDVPHTVLIPRDCLANLVIAIAATVATWIMTTREQRRFADYGFRSGNSVPYLLLGLLSGIGLLSASIFVLHSLDLAVFRGQVLFGLRNELHYGLLWAGFYALGAYVEESVSRGYLQYTLTRGFAWLLRHYFAAQSGVKVAFWLSGVLLSALFALMHLLNSGESRVGLLSAFLFGMLLVFSLWRTGSLWWGFGFHLAWDWAQSFLWGVPDSGLRTRDHLFLTEPNGPAHLSGGATGPEGSFYTLGAYAAAVLLLLLIRPRRVYPELWEEAARDAGETDNMLPDPGGAPARG